AGPCSEPAPRGGPRADRHLGLALRAVARRVLPGRTGATARTGVRLARLPDDRTERFVLLAAAPGTVRPVVRRDAPDVRIQCQGRPLRDARPALARRAPRARQLLRLRRAAAEREAGPVSLATDAHVALRGGAHRALPGDAAARYARGIGTGRRTRRLDARACLAG